MKRAREAGSAGGPEGSERVRGGVGFVAGVLCVLTVQFMLDLGEASAAATPSPGDGLSSRAVVEELRGIREVLETEGALALQRGALAKTSANAVPTQSSPPRERLSPWFEQLDQRLAELVNLIVPVMTQVQAAGFVQGGEALPVVEAFADVELNRQNFRAETFPPVDNDAALTTYSRHHVLWREQQVLDAYGSPEGIGVSSTGEQYWTYGEGDDALYFVVFHGRVIRVER